MQRCEASNTTDRLEYWHDTSDCSAVPEHRIVRSKSLQFRKVGSEQSFVSCDYISSASQSFRNQCSSRLDSPEQFNYDVNRLCNQRLNLICEHFDRHATFDCLLDITCAHGEHTEQLRQCREALINSTADGPATE